MGTFRLDNLTTPAGGLVLDPNGTDQSLTAKSMPAGLAVNKFFLKIVLTLVRGAGGLQHVPQAMSQILSRVVINHGRINWNVRGDMIHLFDTLNRMAINSMSPSLGPAGTNYTLYIPIDPSPVGPPYSKANYFNTEELQNMEMNITLRNPFDTVNDVVDLRATQVELLATYRPRVNNEKEWVSIFRQQDSFQGNSITINDFTPSILLGLGSQADFDVVNIQATGVNLARNADMTDLDADDYFYQSLQPQQAIDIAQGGNQYLRAVPQANGPALDYHKLYDVRNSPNAALPLDAEYTTIINQFGWVAKGYGA